jgi:acyl-CoA synthetase (AMP-forming)/AMP-acid ligase II
LTPYTDAASFTDVLAWRAAHQPERLAFTFLPDGDAEPVSWTYADLDRRARAVAHALQGRETRVEQALLVYPAGLDFVAAFCGCLYAGVAAVPVSPPRPNQSLSRFYAVAADAGAGVALTSAGQAASLKRRTDNDGSRNLDWLATDLLPPVSAAEGGPAAAARGTLAFLQYTSGSTGTPKGVMVTHGNLIHNSEYLRRSFELSPDSVSVCWLPNFHDMSLVDGILQPIYTGYRAVILSPASFLQSPLRWLSAITRYRGTHCGGPNFAYDLCARKVSAEQRATLDLSSWVTAYNGAEPVHRETLERFAEWFAPCGFKSRFFYPCYGMAESTLIISGGSVGAEPVYFAADADALEEHRAVAASPASRRVRHLVGCGRPWLDTEIVVVDPATLTPCLPSRVGEIWTKGGSVAAGYRNRPETTAEIFEAYLTDTGEGPYLRTGDLGFVEDGELFVTGRLKDLIIIRGQNYYPQDIERTVQHSYPGLRPACGAAFSVEADLQERLVVVQEVERTHVRHLDTVAALKAIREAVVNEYGIQVARVVFIRPATIPKTSSGKIQRGECRRQFLEGTLEVVGDAEISAAT